MYAFLYETVYCPVLLYTVVSTFMYDSLYTRFGTLIAVIQVDISLALKQNVQFEF